MKKILAAVVIFAAALGGCSHQRTELPGTAIQDSLVADVRDPDYSRGSLWQGSGGGLAADVKARGRGDVVTIIISEQSSASKAATTATERNSTLAAGIPNLLGLEKSGIKNWMDLSNLINASSDTKYSGSGSTTRQENLNASITAQVTKVLSNGNLVIEGRRNVRVNNEDQIIILEGVIRQRDISPDNTINSIYVANARISYTGKGTVSDRQQPGWLMNIIDAVWPF